jgi:hypothetical protein
MFHSKQIAGKSMNKVTSWLNSIRLDRIVTAFLVGLLVFVSTACSGNVLAKTADEIREEVPSSAVTNEYKGGMNDYSDVDPRFNPSASNAKAKALVDNAQKNIDEKSIDSAEQYVENYRSGTPLGERVKRLGEDIGESADNVGKEAAKGAQENVQNAQEAGKGLKDKGIQTKENTKDAAKGTAKDAKRAVDNASDAGESFGDKIKQSAKDAADAVKSSVNKAADAID